MRKLIIILLFVSCSKEKVKPIPQACDFGLTHFNITKRSNIQPELISSRAPVKVPHGYGVILLDFDGQLVQNTSWNYAGPINCAPANLLPTDIQTIVDSVASKYSRWKVIVTTDEAYYNAAPINKRQRLIFTETYEWYGQAGGVSFLGSFTWGDNTPDFVFTSLLNYNIKFILEAGAHEIGHTLGLYHQSLYDSIPSYPGSKLNEYNPGCCGFAPIMGVAYYQPMSIWITDYNSQGALQNDAAIIGTVLALK